MSSSVTGAAGSPLGPGAGGHSEKPEAQTRTLVQARWTPSLQNCKKRISTVHKLPISGVSSWHPKRTKTIEHSGDQAAWGQCPPKPGKRTKTALWGFTLKASHSQRERKKSSNCT